MSTWRLFLQLGKYINYMQSNVIKTSSRNYVRGLCTKGGSEVAPSQDVNLETAYTNDQQSVILRVLNESSLEELMQYALSKTKANKLIKHRNKHGPFRNVLTILEVDGFGSCNLEWLCDAISYGTGGIQKRDLSLHRRPSCHPDVPDELRKKLESVVSVRLHPTKVMWTHLTRDLIITDWELKHLQNSSFNKPPTFNLQLAHSINKVLPDADAYLLEERSFKVRHINYVPALCSVLQVESMLMTLLDQVKPVFMMKNVAVGNFFRLRLGNERISGREVVDNLLAGSQAADFRKVLTEDTSMIEWYQSQNKVDREELGNCLLQAVAFYELEIANR